MNNTERTQNNQSGYIPFNQESIPPKPPKKSKKWILIVVGVIVAIGIIGNAGKNDSNTPSTSLETSATENTEKQADKNKNKDNASSTTNNESVNKNTDTDNVFNVGDVLDTGKLKITFQKAEDFTDVKEHFQPAEGNKVVRAYFIVENISSSDQSISSFNFDCYADGSSAEEYIWNSDDMLDTTTLSSGRKTKGYVYYEVPADAESIEIEYETSYWTQEKAIFVVK